MGIVMQRGLSVLAGDWILTLAGDWDLTLAVAGTCGSSWQGIGISAWQGIGVHPGRRPWPLSKELVDIAHLFVLRHPKSI